MKDNIFAEIYNRILNLFGQNEDKEDSKNTAVNRLRLVLMQDKTNLTPEIMNRMRKELIEVLSRYVVLDQEALDLNIGQEGEQMALMLSIPVVRAKNEEEIEEALKLEEEAKKAAKEIEEKEEEENSEKEIETSEKPEAEIEGEEPKELEDDEPAVAEEAEVVITEEPAEPETEEPEVVITEPSEDIVIEEPKDSAIEIHSIGEKNKNSSKKSKGE